MGCFQTKSADIYDLIYRGRDDRADLFSKNDTPQTHGERRLVQQCPRKHYALTQFWTIVHYAGPTISQHWVNVSYLLSLRGAEPVCPGWETSSEGQIPPMDAAP